MTLHVAYACDSNYAEQTMVSLLSLLKNNAEEKIHIYLIADSLPKSVTASFLRMAEQYHQKMSVMELDEILQDACITGNSRHPKTIYAKIFLAEICDADKVLYLDSDTVITGELSPLWRTDMQEAYAAGVKMPYSGNIKMQAGLQTKDVYICDGVVLLDLRQWRKHKLTQQCMDYMKAKNGQPFMQSEGVINYVCREHIMALEPRYNLMSMMILWNSDQISKLFCISDYYTQKELVRARRQPVIIHYLNELYLRPWFANSDHPYRIKYLEYRTQAGFHEKLPKGRLGMRTRVLRGLNKNLPFALFGRMYRMIKGGSN